MFLLYIAITVNLCCFKSISVRKAVGLKLQLPMWGKPHVINSWGDYSSHPLLQSAVATIDIDEEVDVTGRLVSVSYIYIL